jgi:hypothetical protein
MLFDTSTWLLAALIPIPNIVEGILDVADDAELLSARILFLDTSIIWEVLRALAEMPIPPTTILAGAVLVLEILLTVLPDIVQPGAAERCIP